MFTYGGEKWKKKRNSILRRDGYKCVECKKFGRSNNATQVHHILHVDDFPHLAYDSSNLVSLCLACHNRMHPEKAATLSKRRYK